jgi:hypothetical protein
MRDVEKLFCNDTFCHGMNGAAAFRVFSAELDGGELKAAALRIIRPLTIRIPRPVTMQEGLFKERNQPDEQLGKPMKENVRVVGLQ